MRSFYCSFGLSTLFCSLALTRAPHLFISRLFCFCCFFCVSICQTLLSGSGLIFAQSIFVPLGDPAYHTIDRIEIKEGHHSNYLHTAVKPFTAIDAVLHAESANEDGEAQFAKTDRKFQYHLYRDHNEWSEEGLVERQGQKTKMGKHLYKYKTDFLRFQDYSDFLVRINPVLNFHLGKSNLSNDSIRFINTRGIEVRGMVSEKLGFYAYLGENQVATPLYANWRQVGNGAVPGEGRFKVFNSRVGAGLFAQGADFFTARGYITFQPIERIRVQMGHDKNFIGNGMRSLLLSDFSNNYYFLKFNTQVWKINYQNLFMELTGQFNPIGGDSLLPKKYAAVHHLSINATKWLNIGLFESVVYGRKTGQFEWQYLNPLLFYRAAEYHLGSSDNVLLGLDAKALFARRLSIYGQFVLDEFNFNEIKNRSGWWANKYGGQIGIKYVDVAGISNLDLQVEWNTVRPYTYSHNTSEANYTHYNQPLAHPLGANFREILGVLQYRTFKELSLRLTVMYAQKGMDSENAATPENFGGNIFQSNLTHVQDYGNTLLQGNKTTITLANFSLSQMWKHNLYFDLQYTFRRQNDATMHYFGGGMRFNIARRDHVF